MAGTVVVVVVAGVAGAAGAATTAAGLAGTAAAASATAAQRSGHGLHSLAAEEGAGAGAGTGTEARGCAAVEGAGEPPLPLPLLAAAAAAFDDGGGAFAGAGAGEAEALLLKKKKKNSTPQMLDVEYQDDADVVLNCDETDDPRRVETTVLQLAGSDRSGLLADVTQLLTATGCDVRSAAVWTYHARVACVLSVTEKGRPLASDEEGGGSGDDGTPMSSDGGSGNSGAKLARLRELLGEMVGAPQGLGICSIERAVQGDVRHDRRLHRLMLEEEEAAWARGEPLGRSSSGQEGGGEDEGEVEGSEEESERGGSAVPEAASGKGKFGEASPTPRAKSPTDSASSMEAPGAASGSGNGAARGASAPPVAPTTPSPPAASGLAPSSPPHLLSAPPSSNRSPVQPPKRPLVRVDPDPRTGYWVVTIR